MDPRTVATIRREIARLRDLSQRSAIQADVLERALAEAERLHGNRDQGIHVTKVNAQEHGLATSKGRAKDPLVKAANKADPPLTLRSLATKVGVSHSLLSQARAGTKSIKRTVAEAIAAACGFAATAKNWPGGITD